MGRTKKGYLRQEWTDPADGVKHAVNDAILFPHETEEDKISYDHLVQSGIIGRRPLLGEKDDD